MEELKVYFKNVGQGDTMFIHWDNDTKFAMIDCNLHAGGIKRIASHIEEFSIKEFEFVIMSHPHNDHFSGFPKLFDLCVAQNIVINKFIHTGRFDKHRLAGLLGKKQVSKEEHQSFVSASVNTISGKSDLIKLFGILDGQHAIAPNGFIRQVSVPGDGQMIRLNSFYNLKFLSPYQYDEYDNYFTRTVKQGRTAYSTETNPENNPHANLLSTVIQITPVDQSCQILLCSDATKDTLRRIQNKTHELRDVCTISVVAVQVPHHGSEKNHLPEFWRKVPNLKNSYTIVSVGEGYGHPDLSVVEFFNRNSKGFHATNYVGGFKTYHEHHNNKSEVDIIDDFSGIFTFFDEVDPNDGDANFCEKVIVLSNNGGSYECSVEDA